MDDEKLKEYVVVTRVAPVRTRGRAIVHTYGPYTRNKAKSVKSNFRAEAVRLGYADRLEINTCHMIDVDNMNKETASAVIAGVLEG